MSDSSPLRGSGRVELAARDLTVCYGSEIALRSAHFNLKGKIIAIIGHNGSGKSTLIKSILGLLAPRQGSLHTTWLGDDGKDYPLVAERHLAFSPENGAVFADMTVESYIKLWCRIKQGRGDFYKREGGIILEQLDVLPLLKKLGRELSKGQRRRVQSAVGFLSDPKLFLFDEPFDGLDIAQSTHLTNLMLAASQTMSIIVSSHRMEVVERLADLIIVLDEGRVVTYGSVEEVCSILCGHSIIISGDPANQSSINDIVPALRESFISCLVSSIGGQVSITGAEINLDLLHEFLSRQQCEGMRLKLVRPSLVDAMHYHLRKLH